MPAPVIDAVAVTSRDLKRSVSFYQELGFDFPEFGLEERHLEATAAPGAVRLMIDTRELSKQLTGAEPVPANHAQFALLYDSPAEVDAAAAAIGAVGGMLVTAPFDAFWGQRYATVADPDGYRFDLFAPL